MAGLPVLDINSKMSCGFRSQNESETLMVKNIRDDPVEEDAAQRS